MVSAVILAYNRCAEVLITIEKLKGYFSAINLPTEIVVVDNASVDNTSIEVKKNYPDVTLVTKPVNNGIAGWNEGFKVARYKYFLVLDDDSHIESGLPEAVKYLETNALLGILALNVTTGPYKTMDMNWRDGQETYGFYGCGVIIRKEVFDKIGGFSEWLNFYAHEWEYGIRCLNAGYKIQYFQNSNINHRASSINRSLKRFWIYSTRNEMGIVYKYFGSDRWRYLLRMFGNNFKPLKVLDFYRVFYCFVGGIKFLNFRKTLSHTPVSKEVQQYFANNHPNTYPVFSFIKRKLQYTNGKKTS